MFPLIPLERFSPLFISAISMWQAVLLFLKKPYYLIKGMAIFLCLTDREPVKPISSNHKNLLGLFGDGWCLGLLSQHSVIYPNLSESVNAQEFYTEIR